MQNSVTIEDDLVTTVKVTNALALYPVFPSWKFTLWMYKHTNEMKLMQGCCSIVCNCEILETSHVSIWRPDNQTGTWPSMGYHAAVLMKHCVLIEKISKRDCDVTKVR